MKIKEIAFAILAMVISFYATNAMVGGVKLTGTGTYSFTLFVILFVFMYGTSFIRHFFLLPKAFYIDILLQVVLLLLYFWIVMTLIGGIRIVSLSPGTIEFMQGILPRAKFSEFGTIVTVSIFLGTVYQALIWLSKEK